MRCRRLEVQSSELKLYVPSQCHTPSASTVTLALPWNIPNAPVPPSNVMVRITNERQPRVIPRDTPLVIVRRDLQRDVPSPSDQLGLRD